MIIFLWLLTLSLFLVITLFIINYLLNLKTHKKGETMNLLIGGIKAALEDCGFVFSNKNYRVELYRWVVHDKENASDQCLERAGWEPMDIADWMKVGLPNTPESGINCGEHCVCELIRCKNKKEADIPRNNTNL